MITSLEATDVASLVCIAVAVVGLLQSAAGVALLARFRGGSAKRPVRAEDLPAMTVLKPLYGDEPLLEEALSSFCQQDYPDFQIVFGAQSAHDPALRVVERLQRRFPEVAIDVVVDATRHGSNGKVGNLINMMRAARHDLLVIADSDIHAPPETLRSVAVALAEPGAGLATALYTGRAASDSLPGRLGTAYINHTFLGGALLARALGRQDCLGAIMALRRDTLEQIGGLERLADNVADDALLGRMVREAGLSVALIDAVPSTTVAEQALPALFEHELRWARTIRSVAPAGFMLSVLQFPLFWAMLGLAFADERAFAWVALAGVWIARAGLMGIRSRVLPAAVPMPLWLLPVRDAFSIGVMAASVLSNRVSWRGEQHRVSALAPAEVGKG